jgi:hypothetical protein
MEPRLAPTNRDPKNISVLPIVISELKLGNVQRQILIADFVERADNAALKDRPETFNRVGMNRTNNVLAAMVINGGVWVCLIQTAIAIPSIRRQQTDFVRHGFVHEIGSCLFGNLFQHARNHVTLALHSADDRNFSRARAATPAALFVPMAVVVLAANPSLINLDNAAKFLFGLYHCGTNFMRHVQRGFVRAEAHLPLDLQRANSLFAGRHQVYDFEPLPQRLVRIFKNGSRNMRETIALIGRAFIALPFVWHRADRKDLHGTATRANDAIRPTPRDQVRLTRILVGKHRLELAFGHLVDRLRTAAARCHNGDPYFSISGAGSIYHIFRASQEADNRL